MCGLCGIVGSLPRERRARAVALETFNRLLLLSEPRGPHATGVAWIACDGTFRVEKAPLPARQFVLTQDYLDWLATVPADVTALLGHTRWPTRGTVHHPANNHPLVAGLPPDRADWSALADMSGRSAPVPAILLCHNGVVDHPDRLAAHWGLPRQAEVDSEVLLQLAVHASSATGLDVPAYLAWLAQVPGRMALTVCDTRQPHQVLLVRGTMPLTLCRYRRQRTWAYASEVAILAQALAGSAGWETVPLPEYHALVVSTQSDMHLVHGIHFSVEQ